MYQPLSSRCPVCGGELVAETCPIYLQAHCDRCQVTLEFPRQIAHSVEELDGVLAAHAARRADGEHYHCRCVDDVIEDTGEARDWFHRQHPAAGEKDAR